MKKLFTVIATLSFLALAGVGTARAQVVDSVEANVPFDFTIGKLNLPAGQYTIKPVGAPLENFMAITDKKGNYLGMFGVEDAQMKGTPRQAELIFHRVGDRYFLYEIFDSANSLGEALPKPRAEKRLEKKVAMSRTNSSDYVTVVALNADSQR